MPPDNHMSSEYANPILNIREKTHGSYVTNSRIAQGIKTVMHTSPKWDELTTSQKESLHLIATKIGRILSGDPNHADSWKDIAGYAQLIEHQIEAP